MDDHSLLRLNQRMINLNNGRGHAEHSSPIGGGVMTWYRARFEAGARAPITVIFESEAPDKKKVEERARVSLAAKTTLRPDNWDMTSLDVEPDPPPEVM